MRENHKIKSKTIIECLAKNFALSVKKLEFLPLGADFNTEVYNAQAKDGTLYFVKLRKNDFHEMSLLVPNMLNQRGIPHIIAPMPTQDGKLWVQESKFYVSVYPFIVGRNAHDIEMSDAHWIEFGKTLKGIHSLKLPTDIAARIPKEDFSDQWREQVHRFLNQLSEKDGDFDDPVSSGLADLLKRKRREVNMLLQRAEQLSATMQSKQANFVLCHADAHAWNIQIQNDGSFYLVDWDTILMAPKERDLMFVASGLFGKTHTPEQEEALFYKGYGDQTNVDPVGLAYYRCERIVRDIAEYCGEIFITMNEGRAEGLRQLSLQFEPGNVVDLALGS